MIRLVLYQPDQAGNVGAVLRLGACLGVAVDIIQPCGFALSDRSLKRSAMDYVGEVAVHRDFDAFMEGVTGRIVLMTTSGATSVQDARFLAHDVLLMGSESGGVPQRVHNVAALSVRIPIAADARSLNLAVAAGIALAEALRQTDGLPR